MPSILWFSKYQIFLWTLLSHGLFVVNQKRILKNIHKLQYMFEGGHSPAVFLSYMSDWRFGPKWYLWSKVIRLGMVTDKISPSGVPDARVLHPLLRSVTTLAGLRDYRESRYEFEILIQLNLGCSCTGETFLHSPSNLATCTVSWSFEKSSLSNRSTVTAGWLSVDRPWVSPIQSGQHQHGVTTEFIYRYRTYAHRRNKIVSRYTSSVWANSGKY